MKDFLEELIVLENPDFLEKYPEIKKIVRVLHKLSVCSFEEGRDFSPFNNLKVSDVKGYLNLLNKGDVRAVEHYNNVAKVLQCYLFYE